MNEVTQQHVRAAHDVLLHLGYSTSESMEPGAGRLVDEVAALIAKAMP